MENVKKYWLYDLDDNDIENETIKYFATVGEVKEIILNHSGKTIIELVDQHIQLLMLDHTPVDEDEGEFALTTVEDYERDGFIGTTGDQEWMYRWICSWLNGDYDYEDYYEI